MNLQKRIALPVLFTTLPYSRHKLTMTKDIAFNAQARTKKESVVSINDKPQPQSAFVEGYVPRRQGTIQKSSSATEAQSGGLPSTNYFKMDHTL
jgi:hypothetical protein